MRLSNLAALLTIPAAYIALSGCGDAVVVHRTDNDAVRDLSGNWNKTDSQLTAKALIAKAMAQSWADDFKAAHNAKPIIKIGRIRVEVPGEVIDTDVFTNALVTALQESGKVRVVAANAENDQAREERKQQDVNASEATRKESFQELGSDYLLVGKIATQNDQQGGQQQKFYAVSIRLTDVKTQEQIGFWNKEITKDVSRNNYK
jgi:PBP1b-binding outer membrane lipoprotein LpoB